MQLRQVRIGDATIVFTDRHDGTETTDAASGFNLANSSPRLGDKFATLTQHTGVPTMILLTQVHGNKVLVADEAVVRRYGHLAGDQLYPASFPVADAAVTTLSNVGLVIRVADCLPVLFVDEHSGVIGAAHAGRTGLLAGVLTKTVEAMHSLGATRIQAMIGPHICGRCYEVPKPMLEEAAAQRPGIRSRTSWGTPALDLGGAAIAELTELAVTVTSVGQCTLEHSDFYSHRGSGGTAGRQIGLIWRK